MLAKYVALVGELLDRAADEVPVLGEAGRSAQRTLLSVATDTDRRMWPLDRLGVATSTRQLVVGSLERRRVVREKADDDLARLLEAVAALLRGADRDAVRTRLLLVPPGTDADLEAPPRDDVERRRHVGEHGWVPVVDSRHERAEPKARSRLGQGRKGDPALEARPRRIGDDRVEVVKEPARLEQLDVVGRTPDLEHVVPVRVLWCGLEGEAHLRNLRRVA